MQNEQQEPQYQQANEMMNKGKKKVGKKVTKQLKKLGKEALKKGMSILLKYVLLPLLPYLLAFVGIILLVYFAWDIVFNGRGKTQNYQTTDSEEYNTVEQNEDGDIVATDLSFGNKVVKSFYTYFAEKSIWITCPDEGVDEPIQYNSEEFINKFGTEDTRTFKDKYGRETMFYISPNALWSLDEFLNQGMFRYPEQLVQPVYNEGKDGNYALKSLTDDKGNLVAQSTLYETSSNGYKVANSKGEKTEGVWDYGFGSILNYGKYLEEAKQKGSYTEIEVWDVEKQQIVVLPLSEADDSKYEGYQDYTGEVYEADMPEANKVSYMIDRVTSPAGTITNKISLNWEDSQEPFTTTVSRTVEVTEKYEELETTKDTKTVKLKCNESKRVKVHKNVDGTYEYKTITYECEEEDGTNHEDHETKTFSYVYKEDHMVEKTRKVEKTLKAYVNGTIWRKIPRYEGQPDTSNIKGTDYYEDYIMNYEAYVPENVTNKFDFSSIKDRTGKEAEELIEILDRQPFSTGSSSSVEVDMSQFELGSGASSQSVQNALQYFDYAETWGNKMGVDPYFIIAMIATESSGNMSSDNGAAYGLMQWEYKSNGWLSNFTLEYIDGTTETVSVTRDSMTNNPELQIKVGIQELKNKAKSVGYNPINAVQSYNVGQGGFKTIVAYYVSQRDGTAYANVPYSSQSSEVKAKVEEVINSGDLGWMAYRQWYKDTGWLVYPGAGGGTPKHVEKILANYISVNGEVPWMINGDGVKVSADGSFEMGSGTGIVKTATNSWLKNAWSKIKESFSKVFADVPNELSKNRNHYSYKVPEPDVDTIIKMMFVMEEQNYLTDYDDFTEEDWKAKYSLLFTNPVGGSWTGSSSSNSTLNVGAIFPNGYEQPLKLSTLTISKTYSINHMAVDVFAPKGTDVTVVADGTIEEISKNSQKGGQYIKVSHEGNVHTIYGNLSEVNVKVGDKVSKGDVIAKTGTTDGNNLHFELLKGGVAQDPTWVVTGFFNASDYDLTEEDAQTINQIIQLAYSKIGSVYTQQAGLRMGPNSFDCSGFVWWLFHEVTGVSIGSYTGDQEPLLKPYQVSESDLQPGDWIFTSVPYAHVVLYIGNGQIIHASNPAPYPEGGVKLSNQYIKNGRVYRPIAYVNAVKGKTN